MSSASARRVVCLAAVAAASNACSSSNKSRQVQVTDAGFDAGPIVVADSGSGGKGGAGGTGGTAGAGGSGTGGLDASADVSAPVPEAGPDAREAGPPPFVCNSPSLPDGSIVYEAGPFTGEWRDFATRTCSLCPGKPVGCDDFPQGQSSYDPGTKVLTMVLAPGIAEVVRGEVLLDWNAVYPDAGYGYGYDVTLPVVVNGNTLTVDLKDAIPDDVYTVYNVRLTTHDACGTQSYARFGFASELGDAQKPALNLHCEI